MDEKLIPCPRCKGRAEIDFYDLLGGFYARCPKCGARTFYRSSVGGAVKLWNRKEIQYGS